jgi:hypothetical protein
MLNEIKGKGKSLDMHDTRPVGGWMPRELEKKKNKMLQARVLLPKDEESPGFLTTPAGVDAGIPLSTSWPLI